MPRFTSDASQPRVGQARSRGCGSGWPAGRPGVTALSRQINPEGAAVAELVGDQAGEHGTHRDRSPGDEPYGRHDPRQQVRGHGGLAVRAHEDAHDHDCPGEAGVADGEDGQPPSVPGQRHQHCRDRCEEGRRAGGSVQLPTRATSRGVTTAPSRLPTPSLAMSETHQSGGSAKGADEEHRGQRHESAADEVDRGGDGDARPDHRVAGHVAPSRPRSAGTPTGRPASATWRGGRGKACSSIAEMT